MVLTVLMVLKGLGPFLILDTLDSDTDPRIGVAFYWDREILLNNIDLDASSKS